MTTNAHSDRVINKSDQIDAYPDGFSTIRLGAGHDQWQGANYQFGISGSTVGAEHLSMNLATLPPGAAIAPHVHFGFEVSLFILSGHVRHRFGPNLRSSVDNGPGDFIYVKPDVAHAVQNLSDTEPVIVVVARSTADEWDKIRPYDLEEHPEVTSA